MEITKQTESFNLKDTTDLYEINGNINREVSGSLNIHFSITNTTGEHLGDCHYHKYNDVSNINFSINCSEVNREEITEYADTLIDSILEHFNKIV